MRSSLASSAVLGALGTCGATAGATGVSGGLVSGWSWAGCALVTPQPATIATSKPEMRCMSGCQRPAGVNDLCAVEIPPRQSC
jgi:hypothetical protein